VNQKNYDHWAPLHTVIRKQQTKAITAITQINQKLKAKGMETFDFNITGGMHLLSPLHLAAHDSQM